jgi:signal transduction histidine kinase
MRYFDRALSEALLGDTTLTGQKLRDEIERLFVIWGREQNQDKQDLIADEIKDLKTPENAAEWDEYANDLFKRNAGNDKFIEAMKKKSRRGETLATWMLRHLISYSPKSA